GPDNGLLMPAAERLGGLREARVLENRDWMLERTSSTFHGRDIFSPMAANIALGGAFEQVGSRIDPASLIQLDFPRPIARDGGLDSSIVYVDSFGNLRLAGALDDLAAAVGDLDTGRRFRLEFEPPGASPMAEDAPWARTF